MSDLFTIYQEQYEIITNRISKLINLELQNISNTSNDFIKICNDIDRNIKEAERIVKQMELDINLNGGILIPNKTNFINNKNTFIKSKNNLDIIKKEFLKFKENFELKKREKELTTKLYSNNNNVKVISGNKYKDQHQPLIDESDNDNQITIISIENESNEKLNQIKRTGREMNSISENIMSNLNQQSEDLLNIKNKVNRINFSIDNSGNMIRSMISTGQRNKYVLGIFSLAMVCMFVLILYTRN